VERRGAVVQVVGFDFRRWGDGQRPAADFGVQRLAVRRFQGAVHGKLVLFAGRKTLGGDENQQRGCVVPEKLPFYRRDER
jgi:hypothetical protein